MLIAAVPIDVLSAVLAAAAITRPELIAAVARTSCQTGFISAVNQGDGTSEPGTDASRNGERDARGGSHANRGTGGQAVGGNRWHAEREEDQHDRQHAQLGRPP